MWQTGDFFIERIERPFFHSKNFEFCSDIAKINSIDVSTLKLKMAKMDFCLIEGLSFQHEVISPLLSQYSAWKISMLPPTSLDILSSLPSTEPSIQEFCFDEFNINFDGVVPDNLITKSTKSYFSDGKSAVLLKNFLTLSKKNFRIYLDSSLAVEESFEKIHSYEVSSSYHFSHL